MVNPEKIHMLSEEDSGGGGLTSDELNISNSIQSGTLVFFYIENILYPHRNLQEYVICKVKNHQYKDCHYSHLHANPFPTTLLYNCVPCYYG